MVDGEGVEVAGGQRDDAVSSIELAALFDARGAVGEGARADLHEAAATHLTEVHLVARRHHDQIVRSDHTVVRHVTPDELHHAGLDLAVVFNGPRDVGEAVGAAQEVVVGDAARHRHQPRHVYDGARAEDHAGGVHDVDLSVGQQRPVDLRGHRGLDPVEDPRHLAGLDELDRLVTGDVEAEVLDDAAVPRVDDSEVPVVREGHAPLHDPGALRIREGGDGQQLRDQRHGEPQAQALANVTASVRLLQPVQHLVLPAM